MNTKKKLDKNIKKQSKYSKNIKTKKNQNKNIKNIYIEMRYSGFGNKIFDLIFSIYLYNLYNNYNTNNSYKKCIINYILIKSNHEKNNDPKINNIFPKSKCKINFMYDKDYKKLKYNSDLTFKNIDSKNFTSLDTFPKFEDLSSHNMINYVYNYYNLIYNIYESFSKKDKDIFINFNKNILTDKTTLNNITYQPYSLIHIRYGDKLNNLKNYINNPDIDINIIQNKKYDLNIDKFLLYTPEYYINKINELLKKTSKNMKIYIITDSVNIVKKFITNDPNIKNNNRVVLLDNMTWWDSFYLFYYASNIILSCSTFAFAGSYFNKKHAKCELVLYHHNKNSNDIALEEYSISPYWKITNERKYILNYNPKIAYQLLKYYYNLTDNY
jgi:hypothetical protein